MSTSMFVVDFTNGQFCLELRVLILCDVAVPSLPAVVGMRWRAYISREDYSMCRWKISPLPTPALFLYFSAGEINRTLHSESNGT